MGREGGGVECGVDEDATELSNFVSDIFLLHMKFQL